MANIPNADGDAVFSRQHQQRLRSLRDAWNARAAAQPWKKGGAVYFKHQLEFFIGASYALKACGGGSLETLCMMIGVGCDINELVKD